MLVLCIALGQELALRGLPVRFRARAVIECALDVDPDSRFLRASIGGGWRRGFGQAHRDEQLFKW